MSFSVKELNALGKLLSANPNEAKTLLKLASLDVLKSLGDGKHSVVLNGKTLTAQSETPLSDGTKYWSLITHLKNSNIAVVNPLKMPEIFQNIHLRNIEYSLKDLQTILKSKEPSSALKQNLLEVLSNASTKEEFNAASTLLLSLQNHVFTIPLNYHGYFSVLQFKKRYNKKKNETQIDFYAALERLGPISGLVTLKNGAAAIEINVAFNTTKTFLENDMKNFSHNIHISLEEKIQPLYNTHINSVLDVSI